MSREKKIEHLFEGAQTLMRVWKGRFYEVTDTKQLSPAQFGIIFYIKKHQPVSGKAIANELQVSASAVTQLVDAIVQLGYAVRVEDPQDRRVSKISLTNNGDEVVAHLDEARRQFFAQITENLTDEEIRVMTGVQAKMIDRLYCMEPSE